MWVKAIKTPLIRTGDSINYVISKVVPHLTEETVVVITSKVFSFAESRLVRKKKSDRSEKWALAKKEADWWLDPAETKHQTMLTIKGNFMSANAGVDESNAEGNKMALWPADPQASVEAVWRFLREHYGVRRVGVVMSDSRVLPLNWGTVGCGLAHCGFEAVKSYVGTKDLFRRKMKVTRMNMLQALAGAANLEMGEGAEQTPLAIIGDVTGLTFQNQEPSKAELEFLKIPVEADLFGPLLKSDLWNRGG
jgi:dihydrofolate synthase / folylpolyglutamate synthase